MGDVVPAMEAVGHQWGQKEAAASGALHTVCPAASVMVMTTHWPGGELFCLKRTDEVCRGIE